MMSINDLVLLIFIISIFSSSFYLLFHGLTEKEPFSLFLSAGFLIPIGLLLSTSLQEIRLGNWDQYLIITPFCFINVYYALVKLDTHKWLRFSVLGLFTLVGPFQYLKLYQSDIFLKTAQIKKEHLIKNVGTANLILSPKHPFIEEVTKFYGQSHLNYRTYVLPSPMHQRDIATIIHITQKYNAINFLVSNEEHESSSEAALHDLISKDFKLRDASYVNYNGAVHPFLPKTKKSLKVLYYVKEGR